MAKYGEMTKLLPQDVDQTHSDQRSGQITSLAHNVHEMADMFAKLHDIVIDQGGTFDNIESNINKAQEHIDIGKDKLTETKDEQGNPCSTTDPKLYFIICLLIGIIIFIIYVVIKYTLRKP